MLEEPIRSKSGTPIPNLTKEKAESRGYLTKAMLTKMHLEATGDPVAYSEGEDGSTIYYYDPSRVEEAPIERWYETKPRALNEPMEVECEDGSRKQIGRMNVKKAATYGYYTAERLNQIHYDVGGDPAAYLKRNDGTVIYFYDKKECRKQPLMCAKCGKFVRYRRKLCEACFEEDRLERAKEGDAHRNAEYHMKRERVLFFDLELTGVYDHDEIISISVTNGNGEVLMDTYVKPVHNKKWKKTEKIHGITPEMVADSPTLAELTPAIKEMFANADNLIAYGISTDFSHIKKIYETDREREELRKKTRCAAAEYVRYIGEHRPELSHASLSDAMETLEISWDGIAHTSIADTIGCEKVWEKLFPNYYED